VLCSDQVLRDYECICIAFKLDWVCTSRPLEATNDFRKHTKLQHAGSSCPPRACADAGFAMAFAYYSAQEPFPDASKAQS
jgi:hypothetical protein